MNKILIIKTGKMPDEISSKCGDMEDYFIQGTGLERDEFIVSSVFQHEALPDFSEISAIIITGAAAYLTDLHAWSEKTASRLPEAVERNIPLLGVCYGHQLLAHSLKGKVNFNPKGRGLGTVSIHLTDDAQNDPLFSVLSQKTIEVQVSHSQSVVELPAHSEILAHNAHDLHHAFRINNKNAWGVQFHPEFTAEIVGALIKMRWKILEEEGLDPQKLLDSCNDTPVGKMLLKRFVEIAKDRQKHPME